MERSDERRNLRIAELYMKGLPVKELAQRFKMTVGEMKILLAELTKLGYIKRRTAPKTKP